MKFSRSMHFAFTGIATFLRKETNGQIQLGIALIVILMGFLFHINTMEWLVVILCISLVLSLEMVNTAMEELCNIIAPEYHPQIKIIKDIAAGSVLLTVTGSVIAGTIIFIPKFLTLYGF